MELFREPGKSLGISIVGGRGMGSRLNNGEVMRGIFIKHILEDSPAGQNGTLKTGDRIVEASFQAGFPSPGTCPGFPGVSLTGGRRGPQGRQPRGGGGGHPESWQPGFFLGPEYRPQAQSKSEIVRKDQRLFGPPSFHLCRSQVIHFRALTLTIAISPAV